MSHNIEDAFSVTEWVRENAERLHFDPERIYLFGHSMGGFTVLNAVADGLKVRGAIVMAPCNLGYKYLYNQEGFMDTMSCKSNGYFNLPSDDYMEQDAAKNAEKWYFPNLVPRLDKSIPYRIIGAAKDTATPPKAHVYPMYEKMVENGYDVEYIELNDGHNFPESRIELACRVIAYLNEMEKR
jgi:dipeptidyl aminopeptidase/acylaminoacyl peptidase